MSTEVKSIDEALFVSHDTAIRQGAAVFEEVVISLREMHAKRLYRFHFATFEDYVRDALGWSRAKAYRALELGEKDQKSSQIVSHGETNTSHLNTEPEAESDSLVAENATTPIESIPQAVGENTTDDPDFNPDETSRPQGETRFETAEELTDGDDCNDAIFAAVDGLFARNFDKKQIASACFAGAKYAKEWRAGR